MRVSCDEYRAHSEKYKHITVGKIPCFNLDTLELEYVDTEVFKDRKNLIGRNTKYLKQYLESTNEMEKQELLSILRKRKPS